MNSKIEKMDKNTVGVAGEFLVAAELEMHGLSASILMKNTKDYDILAINRKSKNEYSIQVKTTQTNKKEWTLLPKNEEIIEKNLFYVFVTLNHGNNYEYHIVPSRIVAKNIANEFKEWEGLKKRIKESRIRKFKDINDKYLNKWELLK